jgi:hypothetical protein
MLGVSLAGMKAPGPSGSISGSDPARSSLICFGGMRVELRTAGMRPRGALRIAVGAPAERLSTRCVAILAVLVAGCGANAVSATNLGLDAGGDAAGIVDGRDAKADGQSEAGTFACGDALCSPSQICLTPAYGCLAETRPDGGVCPGGTEYSDASGDCLQIPPPPSCVSPAAGDQFECDREGDADCSLVGVPIPSVCSHVCRGICI